MDAIKEINDEYRAKLNQRSKEELIEFILHLTQKSFALEMLNKELLVSNRNLTKKIEWLKATN